MCWMVRCFPLKCCWMQLNIQAKIFSALRVVFTREHPSSFPGFLARSRELSLAEVATSGQVSAYIETPVPNDTLVTVRSNFGIACSVTLVGLALGFVITAAGNNFFGFFTEGALGCLYVARSARLHISLTFPFTEVSCTDAGPYEISA